MICVKSPHTSTGCVGHGESRREGRHHPRPAVRRHPREWPPALRSLAHCVAEEPAKLGRQRPMLLKRVSTGASEATTIFHSLRGVRGQEKHFAGIR
eukprot:scaffold1883_cov261-Pinguiococcus_pyrenoidosus.AAC.32